MFVPTCNEWGLVVRWSVPVCNNWTSGVLAQMAGTLCPTSQQSPSSARNRRMDDAGPHESTCNSIDTTYSGPHVGIVVISLSFFGMNSPKVRCTVLAQKSVRTSHETAYQHTR